MRNIIKIAVAVLIMAAALPGRAQEPTEWKRVNDSTWVRWGENAMGAYGETAHPVATDIMVAEINNDLRNLSRIRAGMLGCGALAALGGVWAVRNAGNNKSTVAPIIVMSAAGVASTVLGIVEIDVLYRSRVFVSPEGVVIRIGGTNKRHFFEVGKR